MKTRKKCLLSRTYVQIQDFNVHFVRFTFGWSQRLSILCFYFEHADSNESVNLGIILPIAFRAIFELIIASFNCVARNTRTKRSQKSAAHFSTNYKIQCIRLVISWPDRANANNIWYIDRRLADFNRSKQYALRCLLLCWSGRCLHVQLIRLYVCCLWCDGLGSLLITLNYGSIWTTLYSGSVQSFSEHSPEQFDLRLS